MHRLKVKTAIKVISMFGLGFFLLANTVGLVAHTWAMGMNQNGNMSSCFLTGETTVCQLNVVEHMSLWQKAFASIVLGAVSLTLWLILAWFISAYRDGDKLRRRKAQSSRLVAISPDADLADYLRRAFSQGILQPQIY